MQALERPVASPLRPNTLKPQGHSALFARPRAWCPRANAASCAGALASVVGSAAAARRGGSVSGHVDSIIFSNLVNVSRNVPELRPLGMSTGVGAGGSGDQAV